VKKITMAVLGGCIYGLWGVAIYGAARAGGDDAWAPLVMIAALALTGAVDAIIREEGGWG
jgi:hypothetical protein